MAKIPDGCVLLARKIKDSDIWRNKPAWWIKVWLYMLMQVNHKDNKYFKRGQNFFTYQQIFKDCNLIREGNDTKSIDNLVRWLKRTTQITTHKTTRGFIITVCNYEFYQNLKNYRNDTQNDTENEIKTTQAQNKNDTINKNDSKYKNDKNVKIDISSCWFKEIKKDFPQINTEAELQKMYLWLKDNPRKNHKRTFRNWLLNCKSRQENKLSGADRKAEEYERFNNPVFRNKGQ